MLLYDFSNFQSEFVLVIYCGQVNYYAMFGGCCQDTLVAGSFNPTMSVLPDELRFSFGSVSIGTAQENYAFCGDTCVNGAITGCFTVTQYYNTLRQRFDLGSVIIFKGE